MSLHSCPPIPPRGLFITLRHPLPADIQHTQLELCRSDSLVSRPPVPLRGLFITLRHPLPADIQHTQLELCCSISLFRCPPIPPSSHLIILQNALPVGIERAQKTLCPCMSLFSERKEESSREVVVLTMNRRNGIRIGIGGRHVGKPRPRTVQRRQAASMSAFQHAHSINSRSAAKGTGEGVFHDSRTY